MKIAVITKYLQKTKNKYRGKKHQIQLQLMQSTELALINYQRQKEKKKSAAFK